MGGFACVILALQLSLWAVPAGPPGTSSPAGHIAPKRSRPSVLACALRAALARLGRSTGAFETMLRPFRAVAVPVPDGGSDGAAEIGLLIHTLTPSGKARHDFTIRRLGDDVDKISLFAFGSRRPFCATGSAGCSASTSWPNRSRDCIAAILGPRNERLLQLRFRGQLGLLGGFGRLVCLG